MKKFLLFLVCLLMFSGCDKEENVQISYDDSYYQVATPYKQAVSNYSLRSYNKTQVESMLMNLSSNYFKINNSLYQEGQFLTNDEVKNLITKFNETEEIIVDNVKIKPNYIIGIYEQNYLATNNNLKGISLAIILDNKQYYKNNYYKIIDEKTVLDYGKGKALELIKYLREKELKDIKIVIGLYLKDNEGFKYIGETSNDEIDFKNVNYNYQILDSNYVMNNDINTYNNILAIKNALSYDNELYISSKGLYENDKLIEVNVTINKSYFKQSEILNISNIITNNISNFNGIDIKVYLKSNNVTRAFLNKNKKENKIETYILEG